MPDNALPALPPVLNQFLFNRLLRLYHDVQVSNLGLPGTTGEYYRVNCPFCREAGDADTRHRLWINHTWGCSDGGGDMRQWAAICYHKDCLSVLENRKKLLSDVYLSATAQFGGRAYIREAATTRPATLHRLPGTSIRLDQSDMRNPARIYLLTRGYDPDTLGRDFGVCYCAESDKHQPEARNRIIIPIYYNGQMTGWQARYIGEPRSRNVPKFIGSRGARIKSTLYNYDTAKLYNFVVICEGPLDVWRAGAPAVALFGKSMSRAQYAAIVSTWDHVLVVLDSDARSDADKIVDELQGQVTTTLVDLPDGCDPGSLTSDALWDSIYSQAHDKLGIDLVQLCRPNEKQSTVVSNRQDTPLLGLATGPPVWPSA